MTFDVIETIERNSNNIDKLTSLVSKMNMRMDKCETHISHKFSKVEIEAKTGIDKTVNQTRNRSYSRDRNQSY